MTATKSHNLDTLETRMVYNGNFHEVRYCSGYNKIGYIVGMETTFMSRWRLGHLRGMAISDG